MTTTTHKRYDSASIHCAPAPLLPEIEQAICSAEQCDPEPLTPATAYRLARIAAFMQQVLDAMTATAEAAARGFRSQMYAAGLRERPVYRDADDRRRAKQMAEARKWGFA